MSDILRVYHNARCSKSRAVCALLQERGLPLEVVEYLKTPPSRAELVGLLRKLGTTAESLVRKGEDIYKTDYQGRELDEEAWLDALVAHPILIERPIVVRGERAVVARPPEKVLSLLQD
ncbi:MAG: arsenate reductase (glutaredoxin) [Zoogloea sp.]|uniref:arsenate reductase (glutaredoxin) n=1 Tax=Zoogloea sp. TaxID=49181 RepID=UPI002611778A|nr:arsenate reductase (glutaredoxin) [Zoogloea sp.]MDD2990961.1 arsenate reductase (glutaredoxin) [Zoogloea sp.]